MLGVARVADAVAIGEDDPVESSLVMVSDATAGWRVGGKRMFGRRRRHLPRRADRSKDLHRRRAGGA
jgi:hypothetical protein